MNEEIKTENIESNQAEPKVKGGSIWPIVIFIVVLVVVLVVVKIVMK